jgi:hypothetical protein
VHGNEPSGSVKCWEFLSSCTTGDFSRRAEMHEVSSEEPTAEPYSEPAESSQHPVALRTITRHLYLGFSTNPFHSDRRGKCSTEPSTTVENGMITVT